MKPPATASLPATAEGSNGKLSSFSEEEYNEHLFCEKAPLKRPKRPTCESYQIDDPLE